MSLIIKGLDMPNKGYLTEITDVTIRQFADGKIQIEIPKTSMPYYRLYEAKQIPKKHGRLIDASTETTVKSMSGEAMDVGMLLIALKQYVPTIIEAEE